MSVLGPIFALGMIPCCGLLFVILVIVLVVVFWQRQPNQQVSSYTPSPPIQSTIEHPTVVGTPTTPVQPAAPDVAPPVPDAAPPAPPVPDTEPPAPPAAPEPPAPPVAPEPPAPPSIDTTPDASDGAGPSTDA